MSSHRTWTAVLCKNTVSLWLLSLGAKRGADCNEVVGFFFSFFLYSEITQKPVNVQCSEVSPNLDKVALHLIKVSPKYSACLRT